MFIDFTTDAMWMNTMSAVSLANHLRAVANAFIPLKTHQKYVYYTIQWRILLFRHICIKNYLLPEAASADLRFFFVVFLAYPNSGL